CGTITLTENAVEDPQLSNLTLTDGETRCFDAPNTLTVAGDGTTVSFEDGSSATLIAAFSIRFLPGFHAQEGSYMSAYITTTASFCDDVPAASKVEPAKSTSLENEGPDPGKLTPVIGIEPFVSVFPNPSNGMLTLMLQNTEETVRLRIFSGTGALVYEEKQLPEGSRSLNLAHLRKGFYFVCVENCSFRRVQKLILE
nr:T9SS type A sorting domain-containing protein [Prolixibacteraceae bacterium]